MVNSTLRLYAAALDWRVDQIPSSPPANALGDPDSRYRTLFETLIEGFCTIEMVYDAAGKPVDYRFLEVNPAFETHTGIPNARGRLMREIAPDIESYWAETFGRVATTGEPVRFENEAKPLGRMYEVSAYRIGGPGSHRSASCSSTSPSARSTSSPCARSSSA